MYSEYDKPLHSPLGLKAMESPGYELDVAETDAAIAGLLDSEEPAASKPAEVEARARMVFPILTAAASSEDDAEETGVGAKLRQTWAHLSGAA